MWKNILCEGSMTLTINLLESLEYSVNEQYIHDHEANTVDGRNPAPLDRHSS